MDNENEVTELLDTLSEHRGYLLQTAVGLTDEQARTRSTVSELTVGGVIKHVARGERNWARFITEGPSAMPFDEDSFAQHLGSFRFGENETLAGILDDYAEAASATDELVRSLPSLDASHPLPEAPWFPQGVRWSARRVVLHLIGEISQHAGHADIIREAIDGQKTMG